MLSGMLMYLQTSEPHAIFFLYGSRMFITPACLLSLLGYTYFRNLGNEWMQHFMAWMHV